MNPRHLLNTLTSLAGAALIAGTPAVWAQSAPAAAAPSASATELPQVEAEVRKVDAAAGKVTLRHGDIPNLDMPGMTMAFQVRNVAQLNGLKVGDRVLFRADKANGAYVAVDITPRP